MKPTNNEKFVDTPNFEPIKCDECDKKISTVGPVKELGDLCLCTECYDDVAATCDRCGGVDHESSMSKKWFGDEYDYICEHCC